MGLHILKNPLATSQEELEKDLRMLPQWRREKALAFKFKTDQVLCAKAYLLLCMSLREEYGLDCCPQFGYSENGKPYLKEFPHIHFNLSHCKNAVICIIGDSPVGCDVEEIFDSLDTDLCNFVFNEGEILAINSADNPNVEFSRFWTMKEAYLKLTGEGLTDNIKPLLDSIGDKVRFNTIVDSDDKFVISVANLQ